MIPGVVAGQMRRPAGGLTPPALGAAWPTQGGFYAGEYTVGGQTYYLIDGGYASEVTALIAWKIAATATAGTAGLDDGVVNTQSIVAVGLSDHPAAQHCVSWAGGGFSDWYLPSRAELSAIRGRLGVTAVGVPPNYAAAGAERYERLNSAYWSSTTGAATTAALYNFSTGSIVNVSKTATVVCRPIRRVLKV